ncbi:hypothetical protein [Dietzia psychralcaliphila]|uniref:Uncharacterized protein n=1 Tax=Dietzia psychralcaliphila TaxID=139021 RepID=A0AAD0NP46_9ACTN|nr:hypothetical protein [Dietzia psychralcaliphila]AWH96477.1 hypothetical protein A6048_14375 [Dietzia psychralcaliphila]PTM90372.1 hypothetical protein C8N39_101125 [Dietzia psychralcaliphila]
MSFDHSAARERLATLPAQAGHELPPASRWTSATSPSACRGCGWQDYFSGADMALGMVRGLHRMMLGQ